MKNFSNFLLLRSKLPLITSISNKIVLFPKDFAMVLGAKFDQGVDNMNATTVDGLLYTSS
jgi:hypothetical protein